MERIGPIPSSSGRGDAGGPSGPMAPTTGLRRRQSGRSPRRSPPRSDFESGSPDSGLGTRASGYRDTMGHKGAGFIGGRPTSGKAPASLLEGEGRQRRRVICKEAPASSGAFPRGRGINGLLYAGEKATRRRDGFAGRCRRKREKGKGFGGPQGPRGIGLRRRPRSRLDRAAIAPQQVERVARGSRQSSEERRVGESMCHE